MSFKITRGEEAGEGAGSIGLVSYVAVWLSEVHQTYNLAHGSIIDYMNNNIGSENKSSLAVIYISHRAHHRQFTVSQDACFIGGRVQNPRLPKKFVNSHKHFSNPFSATDCPCPPGKRLMCCEHFIGTHWSNLRATPARPRWLLCPGEMRLETEARKTIEALNQATTAGVPFG